MNSIVQFALSNGGTNKSINIPTTLKNGGIESSPSCVLYNNDIVINTRVVEYTKVFDIKDYPLTDRNDNQTYYIKNGGYHSHNVIGVFDGNNISDSRYLREPAGGYTYFSGLEDVRLVVWDDKLYAYGTRWDKADRGAICIYELNDEYKAINEIVVDTPTKSPCEKNWAAVEDKPFTFIYYTNPQTIIQVNPEDGSVKTLVSGVKYNIIQENLRGNSNLVRFDDESYIELVHESEYTYNNGVRELHYKYAFVFYNNDLEITNISRFFIFNQPLCEFSCGLCFKDDNIYITYSELDASANMLIIPKESLVEFLMHYTDDNNTIDKNYFIEKVNTLISGGNTKQAMPFINFCLTEGIYNGSEKYLKLIMLLSYICQNLIDKTNIELLAIKSTLENIISEGYYEKECYYLLAMIYRILGDLEQNKICVDKANNMKQLCATEFLMFINPHYL